jgi:predicted dehydrogenase
MSSATTVAMIGISGYGEKYLTALFNPPADARFEIVGMVDPRPERSRYLDQIRDRRIPLHADLESLYTHAAPELVMMATPIHLHAPHSCYALARGSNVLCEKPIGADINDARRMLAAERTATGFVAIGFQWSFSRSIQQLKRDIMAGDFGRPVRLKTIACWPRDVAYFRRNDWVGRIRTDDGIPVFDSPANNATSHFLHNMLYLLGPQRELSATPRAVQAELYRANDIENYDTAAIRCQTDCGTELLFYTSHALPARIGPVIHYEFENAVVYYEEENGGGLIARFQDGSVRHYGDPNVDRHLKIWEAMHAVRTSGRVACGVRGASSHALCVSAAQASSPVQVFPDELITDEVGPESEMKCVRGLTAALVQCYDQGILPAEHTGLDWAEPGEPIDLRGPDWALEQAPEREPARVNVKLTLPRKSARIPEGV